MNAFDEPTQNPNWANSYRIDYQAENGKFYSVDRDPRSREIKRVYPIDQPGIDYDV